MKKRSVIPALLAAGLLTGCLPFAGTGKYDLNRGSDVRETEETTASQGPTGTIAVPQETTAAASTAAEETQTAASEAETPGTKEQLLTEYAQNELLSGTLLDGYREKQYIVYRGSREWSFTDTASLQEVSYDGILTAAVHNYDSDQDPELLVVRLESVDDAATRVILSMYEAEDGEVCLAAETELFQGLEIYLNDVQVDFFAKEFADGPRLYCELNANVYMGADGIDWNFYALEYRDGSFSDLGEDGFAGSDWEDSDLDSCRRTMSDAGLEAQDILYYSGGRRIVEQDGDTVLLAEIRRSVTLTHSERMELYSRVFHAGDQLVYGYTEFENHVKADLSHPETQERLGGILPPSEKKIGNVPPPAGGTDGDYILPTSSSELLSDSVIAAVPKELRQMAVNEIYARHGRKFKNAEIQAYFDSKPWYSGTIEADDFKDSYLTSVERENIQRLKKSME